MRRFQQSKILELLRTLDEANGEIKRFLSRKKIPLVTQILADCQEFAISIGDFIESIEGEGTKTVALLDEYCKFIYELSLEVDKGNRDGRFVKHLKKKLIKIENSVQSELKPNRIEMAFFPYKASMFDSLESIWLAAKDDPQCDAYVVPIPYYDKLSGGALGQMHYEGDQYPDDIPVVEWQEYDVEARHPDVIFIHSPYDDGNYVTSIHPDYYSKRLKDFTDLLVYVPYFVVVDDVEEHFCVCAGTIYADKVIVQSEKVRNTYIRVFKGFEEENNCKNQFGNPEDKFVALGSPKFDKVFNAKREEYALPDEWNRLITLPDGSNKKVVLYNTSIGAMLQGNEEYLNKLRSVLQFFQERDDVVLWWRPHPLSEATYQAMRPHLYGKYKRIVEEYRRGGRGSFS